MRGVVAVLEAEVAGLLGLPAAVYLPSGTMAQQVALRVHAGRRGRRTVLCHPECHLLHHEGGALERRLPAWDDLVAQTTRAGERGAAVHLDGARLWEATAGYGRTPAEIAALFDTTYVSSYKGLGALAGCCLAGPADVVAEVREWRGRMGGTLFGLWPGAASALTCLRRRLPLMPAHLERAVAVADAVRGLPGVTVVPDPPQTPMLHLLLRTTPDAFAAAARDLATGGLRTWPRTMPTADPAVLRVELPVGDATLALPLEEIRAAVGRLAA